MFSLSFETSHTVSDRRTFQVDSFKWLTCANPYKRYNESRRPLHCNSCSVFVGCFANYRRFVLKIVLCSGAVTSKNWGCLSFPSHSFFPPPFSSFLPLSLSFNLFLPSLPFLSPFLPSFSPLSLTPLPLSLPIPLPTSFPRLGALPLEHSKGVWQSAMSSQSGSG